MRVRFIKKRGLQRNHRLCSKRKHLGVGRAQEEKESNRLGEGSGRKVRGRAKDRKEVSLRKREKAPAPKSARQSQRISAEEGLGKKRKWTNERHRIEVEKLVAIMKTLLRN